jgi:hypothetical protein
VKIVIPKKDIGAVPSAKVFDPGIIDGAIAELKKMRQLNITALARLRDFNPDNYLSFVSAPYIITYFDGNTVVKPKDFRLAGVTREEVTGYGGGTIRYWSLEELATKCREGVGKIIKVKGQDERITPCEALKIIREEITFRTAERDLLIERLKKVNRNLDVQLARVTTLKTEISKISTTGDNLILIDAFLRGWCFKPGSTTLGTQLTQWYNRREIVWKNILRSDQDFNKRLGHKSNDRYKAGTVIAGIFQSEDVFFAVSERGDSYIVTPYKMLSGNFSQVVDRDNSIVQFVSENNFRLTKL